MAAFSALCFSLTAQAQGPVVVSDKDDYSPGESALFQAAGFQPNELLDFKYCRPRRRRHMGPGHRLGRCPSRRLWRRRG